MAVPAVPAIEAWQPGDPMNTAQAAMAAAGKPLWVISQAADNPPDTEIALAWPNARQPFAPVESGRINPPEAPPVPASSPEQAIQLQNVAPPVVAPPVVEAPAVAPPVVAPPVDNDRATLKARAVSLGLITDSSKLGAASLRALLEAVEAPPVQAVAVVEAPPVEAAVAVGERPEIPPPAPPAPPVVEIPPAAPVVALRVSDKAIGTLYINCVPFGEPVTQFRHLAERALEALRAEHPQIPHYAMADYGKGPGLWAAAVDLEVRTRNWGAVCVDTRSREGADALAVLERHAAAVVRGF
jgi:hypothetical protein